VQSLAGPACAVLLAAVLVLPAGARATDASLKRTLTNWSQRIAADANGIGVSASRRHPRRMTSRATVFRLDAVRAKRALSSQRPSSTRGRRARHLALAAFGNFATVGKLWVLSGQARLHHRNALAEKYARLAAGDAATGNRRLTTAGRLMR